MKRIGISEIGIEVPAYSLQMADLASARGMSPERAEMGLGVVRARIPVGVSIAELAAAAVQKIQHQDVQSFIFATESDDNLAKPIALKALDRLELLDNVFVAQLKFACLAGTQALIWACQQAALTGKPVIVVMADRSVYRDDNPAAEVTQGCAAVALRVENSPRTKIEVEFDSYGVYAADIDDFHVPVSSFPFPIIDGPFSTVAYCYCVTRAYQHWRETNKEWIADPLDALHFLFHVPFPKMVSWAAASIWAWEKRGENPLTAKNYIEDSTRLGIERERLKRIRSSAAFQKFYGERVMRYLSYNCLVGNAYTGSGYLSLIAAAERGQQEILFLSYGSGAGAIALKLNIVDCIQTDLAEQLEEGKQLTMVEYEAWREGLTS